MRPVLAPLLVSAFAAASASIAGCGDDCPDIGCLPEATVTLEAPLAATGEYTVAVRADGEALACTIHLPAKADDGCNDERLFVFQGRDTAGAPALTGLSVIGEFDELAVNVSRDGEPVGSQSFRPTYDRDSLDAAACGTCPRAENTLEVTP